MKRESSRDSTTRVISNRSRTSMRSLSEPMTIGERDRWYRPEVPSPLQLVLHEAGVGARRET